ncbi:GNAT family N-acetyltransferase [Sedimentibacter sp.]|uniref:GNAT family N-acetyltransferase n=1 Tax=Sedimentibacter sp. TaxID=1960295 RepID=UPI0028AB88BE|nr:GNAT family N-acetyltransferase [Sedimentibacter sp.]
MIRQATEQDRMALGKIYCFSWKEAYKNIVPDEYLNSLTIEKCSPNKINSNDTLVIEDNGIIVGLTRFGEARDKRCENIGELWSIYILPEFWMKGFGQLLFSSVTKKLEELGYEKFYLWVLKDNFGALRFYEKMGMINTDIEQIINIGGKDLVEIKYEFSLKNSLNYLRRIER